MIDHSPSFFPDKSICFSLWGDQPHYYIGAIKNAELVKLYLPEWLCVFFVHKDVPKRIQDQLLKHGLIVVIDDAPNHLGMFWRWSYLISDQLYRTIHDGFIKQKLYFLSRDCDSRITKREADEINAWVESGKTFHSIIAHPYHNIPMLGGLWGCIITTDLINNFTQWMAEYKQSALYSDRYQVDQDFLSKFVYPFAKNDMFVSNMMFKQQNPDYSFIGEGLNEHDEPIVPHHREVLKSYTEILYPIYHK